MNTYFARFAGWSAWATGHPLAFAIATTACLVWAASGPMFNYSDTWQLVINTGTTIITFLMVFLIQNTQNRDTEALQIKLDELLRAVGAARNTMIDLEELDDEELEKIREEYLELARKARTDLERRGRKGDAMLEEEHEASETGKDKLGARR